MNGQGVFHQTTVRQLQDYLNRPTHALLITGPEGGGKLYVARILGANLMNIPTAAIDQQPHYRHIETPAEKSSIGIEVIRDLQQFTKLKLPAGGSRVIVLSDAHTMTTEAQNALLKLLEEPPAGTYFILTAVLPQSLLPTIRSRTRLFSLQAPPQDTLLDYFQSKGYEPAQVKQTYMQSGGLPGLMTALLDNIDHPLKSSVETARQLLRATQFERLCLVDGLAKNKEETMRLLFILQHMARAAITQAARQPGVESDITRQRIRQWHRVLKAAYEAETAYAVSAQAKLALTNLMLSL